jgi:hypothetical protein
MDGRPSTTLTRPSFSPGKLLKKQAAPKPVQPGDAPPTELPAPPEGVTAHGDEVNGEDAVEFDDGLTWDSEVDEIILVRKLAALQSLRDRRTTVLKQLEVVCLYPLADTLLKMNRLMSNSPKGYLRP